MISYDPDEHPDGHYLLSYSSLREDYLRYTMMSDEDFTADLLNTPHAESRFLPAGVESGAGVVAGEQGCPPPA